MPPAPQQPLFSFETITEEAPRGPSLVTLYGVPKIGKTHLVCSIPRLFIVCPEDGLANIPRPAPHFKRSPRTLTELYQALDGFAEGNRQQTADQRFHHLAIDSLSWLELMVHQVARAEMRTRNLDADYKTGWGQVQGHWDGFFERMLNFRRRCGVHVWLVAHAEQRPESNAEGDTWQKWDLQIDKKAAALTRKLSDHVLFLNWGAQLRKAKGKRAVGQYTGRVLFFRESADHFAGSRSGAPDVVPAEWSRIEPALAFTAPASVEKLRAQIEALLPQLTDVDRAEVEGRVAAAKTPRDLSGALSMAQSFVAAARVDAPDEEEPPPAAPMGETPKPPAEPAAPASRTPTDDEDDEPPPALGAAPAAGPGPQPGEGDEAAAERIVREATDAGAIGKAFVALSKIKTLSADLRQKLADQLRQKKAGLA